VLKNVSELIRFQAKQKGLQYIVENSIIDHFERIYADPNRLQQILLNLLSNALKFTEKGFLKLKVTPELRMVQGERESFAVFSVQDSGPGIPEPDLPRLFRLFGKLDQGRDINKHGVGLGLAISQNLARMMLEGNEGGIKVDSTLGLGSTFYFSLKILSRDMEENFEYIDERTGLLSKHSESSPSVIYKNYDGNSDSLSDGPQKRGSLSSPNFSKQMKDEKWVLVVDDDPINLMVAKNYLELFGLKYMTASNGKTALELIDICRKEDVIFDLILMDCKMPVLDGFETAREIRRIENERSMPPVFIIACTANVELSDVQMCYDSGMDYYLSKPIQKMNLRVVLEKYLNIEIQA
jgi:CheY-like chemotaxis protein